MVAEKNQYWFRILEPRGRQLTLDLFNHKKISVEGIGGKKGWSRGRFTFWIDEPGLEDVKFQVTTRDKIGIYVPVGLDVNEVLTICKPIFDKAAGRNVRLKMYFPEVGKMEEARLEEEIPEEKPLASYEAVSKIIEKIDSAINSEHWGECNSWITELRQLCIHNRTGHIAELLGATKRYVNTLELFENEETRRELAMTMTYILENEKESGNTENSNEVTKQFLESVRKIALYDRKNGLRYSLRFLGKTEVQESVDIISDLINQRPQEITNNLEDEIHYVLFGSELAKAQKEYIRERLVELSSSGNQAVRSVDVRLQKRSRLYS